MNTPPDEDALAGIAAELAIRVRDETPEANGRWLAEQLPDSDGWWALCFVLAAAVPDDRSWRGLTAWTVVREQVDPELVDEGPVLRPAPSATPKARELQPCGTFAAAERHRYHGEEVCEPCRQADRDYDRERKRIQRRAA